MKAISYLLKTTIINYFKRLKQKPQKAIGPIFVVLWFSLMLLPKGKGQSAGNMNFDILIAIFLAIVVSLVLYSLYSGTKKLNSKFGMCDVNLIFVSPIKPQTVLLYGVIKKIAVELMASIYILYQIPNALRNFNVPAINQFMLIIAFVIFQLVFCSILKLFIFALNTKYNKLGELIRLVIKAILIASGAYLALVFVRGTIIETGVKLLNTVVYSPWVGNIPVIGWMRELAVQVIKGMNPFFGVYLLLLVLLSALMLYITYNLKLDYYEDMLSGAERYDALKNKKMTKETAVSGKTSPFNKPFRKTSLKLKDVYGAKVLFFKHLNEYLKRSLVFFINTYSIILLAVSVVLGIYVKSLDIKFLLLAASGLLFFSAGMASKIYNEIYHYFIFILPDTPQRKLFYGMASSLVKAGTDAVILFLPFGILTGAPVFEILFCMICYVVLAGMLSYSGLAAFRIAQLFGFDGLVAQGLFFMLFQLLLAVPLVILSIVLTIGFMSFNGYAIYLSFLIYSISMAIFFSFACVGIFKNNEF